MRASVRSVGLLLLAAVVGMLLLGGSVPIVTTPLDAPDERDPQFVELDSETLQLWPYVSADPSFVQPASSINVVFHGNPARVKHILTRTDAWNESVEDPPGSPADPEAVGRSPVLWRDLASADRYTYVREDGSGRWVTPSYQLHRGDYFGSQHHLRVYEISEDRVVVQAHTEHWDWLLLTHVVDSLQAARLEIESDFMGRSYVEEVHREYYDNGDTYDADGWATVIRLTMILPVVGVVAFRSRASALNTPINRRRVGLAVSLPTLVLGVRLAGIAAERTVPLSFDTISLLLYPFVAVGLPLAAHLLSRRLPPTDAFVIAAVALGLAVRFDYSILMISAIPIEIVVHRATAAVAVGLIAAGAGAGADEPRLRNVRVVGAGLWLAVLVAVVV